MTVARLLLGTPAIRRCAASTRILLVACLAIMAAGSVSAQERIEISAEPAVAYSVEPVTLTISGFTTCPFFEDPEVDSRITIRWDNLCFAPGPLAPFEISFTVGPLPPRTSVLAQVVDGSGSVVAQTRIEVRGDETTYELIDASGERLDAFISSLEEVTLRIVGVDPCPRLGPVERRADTVEVVVETGCSFSPPLPREFFQFDLPLGRLRTGIHEIRLVDGSGSLLLSCSLQVFEERPVLELSPPMPSASEPITATVTLPGTETCPLLRGVTVDGHFVRIDFDDTCLVPPPPVFPSPTVSFEATIGPLEAAPYDVEVRDTTGQVVHVERLHVLAAERCVTSETTLCLNGGRFRVEVSWRTFGGGSGDGHAVASTDDSGLFYFFGPDNIELLVKVLDACSLPSERYWVFVSGLTNVEVELEVKDLATGQPWSYFSPLGSPFQPVFDTQAFATCP